GALFEDAQQQHLMVVVLELLRILAGQVGSPVFGGPRLLRFGAFGHFLYSFNNRTESAERRTWYATLSSLLLFYSLHPWLHCFVGKRAFWRVAARALIRSLRPAQHFATGRADPAHGDLLDQIGSADNPHQPIAADRRKGPVYRLSAIGYLPASALESRARARAVSGAKVPVVAPWRCHTTAADGLDVGTSRHPGRSIVDPGRPARDRHASAPG